MARKQLDKVPEWFWKEKESNVINFIINYEEESDICRNILLNNEVMSFGAIMLSDDKIMVTIIYKDNDSLKNDYTRSVFKLSDYVDFYKIEHRKKKINKIVNNL